MKVGIVSDIHGNVAGLRRALEIMGDIDELLCCGDSIDEYRFSNETVALLRERQAHTIQGNHEEVFFSDRGKRAREREEHDKDLLLWLGTQPFRRELEFGGRKFVLVHSTAWAPYGEYIQPHSSKLARFAELEADFVLYGHTHAQVVKRFDATTVINPGSAGDGRDRSNNRQLSCAVVETATTEVQVFNFPDPRYAPPT